MRPFLTFKRTLLALYFGKVLSLLPSLTHKHEHAWVQWKWI